jgi:hypothetical protein
MSTSLSDRVPQAEESFERSEPCATAPVSADDRDLREGRLSPLARSGGRQRGDIGRDIIAAPPFGAGESQLLDKRMGHCRASSSRSSAAKTSAITRAIGARGKSSRIDADSVSIALYGAPLPVWARMSVRTRTMGFLPKA